MNIDELSSEIERDEGRVNAVYLDPLSLPTIGIGHLVVESDREYGLAVGTRIDDERVNELFEQDIQVTISECEKLFSNFNNLPDEVQKICANMMFNLGRPRFSKFKKFHTALLNTDWQECAVQMEDSRWHKQVTKRANLLISRMRAVEST